VSVALSRPGASISRSGALLTWSAGPPPNDRGVVYVTELHLARLRDVPAFFRTSMAIRSQVRRSAGARALVLNARPLARRFTTVSWWDDEAAVRAFVRTDPHKASMRRWRPRLAGFRNEGFPGTAGVAPTLATADQEVGGAA
jgi:hypothetical protein